MIILASLSVSFLICPVPLFLGSLNNLVVESL